jgi:hypothetical protein
VSRLTEIAINDIDHLYDDALIEHSDGTFECKICGKTAKRRATIESHIDEKDCYNFIDMFQGTHNEVKAYKLYQAIIAELHPNSRVSIPIFRRSSHYRGTLKAVLFGNIHKLGSMLEEYARWMMDIKQIRGYNAVVKYLCNEENLREFRQFCRQNSDIMINSTQFYARYRDDLITDIHFFIRSLERAEIGLKFIINQKDFPLDDAIELLPADYAIRLEILLDELEN